MSGVCSAGTVCRGPFLSASYLPIVVCIDDMQMKLGELYSVCGADSRRESKGKVGSPASHLNWLF